MEHGLQISLKRYALSMKDKMAAGAFGRATNYGPLKTDSIPELRPFCGILFLCSATPILGFVDDYGFLIRGLLDLYEASLDEQWLIWAIQVQDKMDELFWDSDTAGYYQAMEGDTSILVRMKEGGERSSISAGPRIL